MAKLHFLRHGSEVARGDGTVSNEEAFDVDIHWGHVKRGYSYKIQQGQRELEPSYDCKRGAEGRGTARFRNSNASASSTSPVRFLGASYALMSALEASTKKVNIEIATSDLEVLKGSKYKLCFAKKVGDDDYNVVWQSYLDYLPANQFSWTPQYQLFGSNRFAENVEVLVSTNLVTIGLGEESVLNSAGVLEDPRTGGGPTAITMINEYGTIHPGLAQLSTGVDGKQVSTPIYVAPDPAVRGEIALTPVEKVLVWFEQEIETSTMFSTARSMSIEIDMTTTNEARRLYKNQEWSTP